MIKNQKDAYFTIEAQGLKCFVEQGKPNYPCVWQFGISSWYSETLTTYLREQQKGNPHFKMVKYRHP